MGKFSILLCDSDEIYVKRLATGLQKFFREQVFVQLTTDISILEQCRDVQLLLTSKLPSICEIGQAENCKVVFLHEGQEEIVHKESIYKYQSITQIGKELMKYMPRSKAATMGANAGSNQKWYGVLSPVRHKSMIPFGITLAQQLSVGKRTLVLIFMEFSGIGSWLGVSTDAGAEDWLLDLRHAAGESFLQLPFAKVHQLPAVDVLHVTSTPMVLYELTEEDVHRLIQRIQCCDQYDAVVWISGNMLRGMKELLQTSGQVFCIEDRDGYSRCCQQEFIQFFQKLGHKEEQLKRISLPVLHGMEPGEHLLLQWKNSVIGEEVRNYLKGDVENGTFD